MLTSYNCIKYYQVILPYHRFRFLIFYSLHQLFSFHLKGQRQRNVLRDILNMLSLWHDLLDLKKLPVLMCPNELYI